MLREYFDLQRILEGITKGKEKFAALRKDEDVTQLILALRDSLNNPSISGRLS
jgi:hypothetical protein